MKELTCFIVDDEIMVANRMKTLILNFTDIKVAGLESNPDKALKKIVTLKPDIIFLDVEMPGMSGFELIEALRAKNCHPCFIMVTAFDHYSIKAIKEAAFDYLLKPVDIDELRGTIERYKSCNRVRISSTWIEKHNLSKREEEIITYLLLGETSVEIAKKLFLSKHTVDTHRRNILRKTGLKSTSALHAYVLDGSMTN